MEEEEGGNINFIPCIKWVKKGIAKSNPEKVQLTKDELIRIINETKNNLRISDNNEQGENSEAPSAAPMNVNDEYNFENYDTEEADTGGALFGLSSLADVEGEVADNFSESDESDKEDEIIKPEDSLILVARIEGDASMLEVHVYNEIEESLYVHHDILLNAYPLCLEWLDHEAGHAPGNYCAIGSMSHIIDVWDLDIINCLDPAFQLGRKPSRKKNLTAIGHTDAVLDLAWNRFYDHILASGSVDKSILLWDLDQGVPATTIKAFTDNVQCLDWHKLEAQTLLAGSSDHTVKVFDCRSPDNHQTWQLAGEAERITWDPLEPFSFFVGTNIGDVQYFDCRKGEVFKIAGAHTKEVTGLSVSNKCPGLFVTSSADKLIKVWDFKEGGLLKMQPDLVFVKKFDIGLVHCLELCPDLPFVIASGGDNKTSNFKVFDLQNIDTVKSHFGSRALMQLVKEESAS